MTTDSEPDQRLDTAAKFDREDAASLPSSRKSPAKRFAIPSIIRLCLLLFVGAAIGWGASQYRKQLAIDRLLAELQGHWQLIEVNGADRTYARYYLTVTGEMLRTRQFAEDGSIVLESHWELFPENAGEFLRLRMVKPDADRYEPQYHWRVRNDTLTQIRGILFEDPVREPEILTYQRVSDVPAP